MFDHIILCKFLVFGMQWTSIRSCTDEIEAIVEACRRLFISMLSPRSFTMYRIKLFSSAKKTNNKNDGSIVWMPFGVGECVSVVLTFALRKTHIPLMWMMLNISTIFTPNSYGSVRSLLHFCHYSFHFSSARLSHTQRNRKMSVHVCLHGSKFMTSR